MVKLTYNEMIQEAIMTLDERNGSTRQEIWKCLQAKFPVTEYKVFLLRLRRLSKESQHIVVNPKNKMRFQLSKEHRAKIVAAMKKNRDSSDASQRMSVKNALRSSALIDKQKAAKKAAASKAADKIRQAKAKTAAKEKAAKLKAAEKAKKAKNAEGWETVA